MLTHRPGGITAMTDQQLAGGVMWVLGSISYSIAIFFGFYRWLEPERATAPGRAGDHDLGDLAHARARH